MKKIDEVILFGNKEDFALQLGMHTNSEKCKLCFWVEGRKMGSFTKGGQLKYSIKAFEKFTANKEIYYEFVFDKKSPSEIRRYFVDEMFALGNSDKKQNVQEYERRERFRLFWGDQFTNDGSLIQLLYKANQVVFIYQPPNKLITNKYATSYEVFCDVFEEYITYCKANGLI